LTENFNVTNPLLHQNKVIHITYKNKIEEQQQQQ